VLQACEAIAEAHTLGIVHRDLKPTNLFLTTTVHGRPLVKVLDFGISKVAAASPEDMQLTKTTEIIGSPSYMSPEQLRSSRNVDARADIWALGVIIYELLAGRLPFIAETVTELVLRVATEREPPLRSIRPDVPTGLEAIALRCLEKHPERRFQSVLELAQALEPYSRGVQSTATDRIRAVAAGRGPHAITPTSGAALMPPAASSSARVIGHGGTSVAWGETHSLAGARPAQTPSDSRNGRRMPLLIGGVALAAIALGGIVYVAARPHASPARTVGAEENLPLPPGRKDLPPVPSVAPSPAPPAPSASDPPAASTLPETRKPPAHPAAKSSPPIKTTPTPTPPTDDLSNIGRR
jgi:serine/threonine-protein kinase